MKVPLTQLVAVGVFAAIFFGVAECHVQAACPNVLFIAVDDLKPLLGCYGDATVETPNIDALAASGVVFLNAYCQQTLCGPSRSSLLTGLRPDTTRVWGQHTRFRDALPDVVTLPQHFQAAGYETLGIAKTFDPGTVDGPTNMDKASWSRPYIWPKSPASESFGFQNPELVKLLKAKMPRDTPPDMPEWRRHLLIGHRPPTDMADVGDEAYDDGAIASKAVEVIRDLSRGDAPFFLAIGFAKPHLPFCAPKRYWDLYDRHHFEIAETAKLPNGAPEFHFQDSLELRSMYTDIPKGRLPDELQRELIHGYHACVSYVDAQIGKVLDALVDAGVDDNTVVVLWGDHGWHLGDHGMWGKQTNYEEATRSPLVFRVPGKHRPSLRSTSPVELVDIFPTLCEMAGIQAPRSLEGTSLAPLLDGSKRDVKPAAVSQHPREVPEEIMGYAFRTNRYRLVQWYPFDKLSPNTTGSTTHVASELYDYDSDPLEKRNVIGDPKYAEVVKELSQIVNNYWKSRAALQVSSR